MTDPTSTPPPDLRDYAFGESVGYLISRAKSTISNMVTQRTLAELGVTSQQASVLFMVASGKCLLAAELAREYGIDASAVTRLVDRLEKRGLLQRVRSSEDRRAVRLALTPEGEAIAARMPPIFTGVIDSLTNGFTPEEIGFLKSMLRRILANSGSCCDTGDSGTPPANP
ncbi:MarR family winged helix-turn-helix transcriptional regulator [Paraburkholderia caballeronis]|uniref:DNA-binding transcriptional regulator, MarR family n=1 Tax=Paraburkholderia caballeronis TaxID=416943 RepID=A0A1H7K211_9BURK|nr:MarR family winged helix-turn-helix transcriptional regulator [Paraburkholderia caballeronis]PXW27159.1 MarR family transcriptional regulator [Paraburkholderia caballeronis]PXX02633.1 MarR family transcriptional regulator [Paraburkholderia caballeronis]RAK03358.1 MarR family transcriptional regulator [Paraburkholderia caballeronis]SEC45614.1 transcriptional regulator, MarR family [Paraburkholderia caballeronis]SEK80913.1 DNA-binding transcriptional regulator, MarR family [Paraburkholderia c